MLLRRPPLPLLPLLVVAGRRGRPEALPCMLVGQSLRYAPRRRTLLPPAVAPPLAAQRTAARLHVHRTAYILWIMLT